MSSTSRTARTPNRLRRLAVLASAACAAASPAAALAGFGPAAAPSGPDRTAGPIDLAAPGSAGEVLFTTTSNTDGDAANEQEMTSFLPATGWARPQFAFTPLGMSVNSWAVDGGTSGTAVSIARPRVGGVFEAQARVRPAGLGWGQSTRLSPAGTSAYSVTSDMSDSGEHAVAAWVQYDAASSAYRAYASRWNAASGWSAGAPITPVGISCIDATAVIDNAGIATIAASCDRTPADGADVRDLMAVRGVPGAWSAPERLTQEGDHVTTAFLAVAPDGAVAVAWSAQSNPIRMVEALSLPAGGAGWTPVRSVSDASMQAGDPSIEAVGPGAFAVAWMQDEVPARSVWVGDLVDGQVTRRVRVSDPADGQLPPLSRSTPGLAARTVDGVPTVAVAWAQDDRANVAVRRGTQWGDRAAFLANGVGPERTKGPATVVGGDGLVTVAWQERIDGTSQWSARIAREAPAPAPEAPVAPQPPTAAPDAGTQPAPPSPAPAPAPAPAAPAPAPAAPAPAPAAAPPAAVATPSAACAATRGRARVLCRAKASRTAALRTCSTRKGRAKAICRARAQRTYGIRVCSTRAGRAKAICRAKAQRTYRLRTCSVKRGRAKATCRASARVRYAKAVTAARRR